MSLPRRTPVRSTANAYLLIILSLALAGTGLAQTKHFDPKGKLPSKHTIAVLEKARKTLPFSDKRDFEEQKKGFIAAPKSRKIMANAGNVAWDMERYGFFLEGKDFDSIHPSLQRQGTLNMNFGLYEVSPGIYQVRGFDLANISYIRGETGWIVFDPLTAEETARAAQELVDEHLGKLPIKAVVYSHSHGDHWAACAASSMKPMFVRARSRSSRPATSCSTPSPRTSTPATR
jgi:alkyl sulfatase BDS1-like metallo-beta-lactamase superfamily hydrolase